MKAWQVKASMYKSTDDCLAFCPIPSKCSLEKCSACQWLVGVGSKWVMQPTVTISLVSNEGIVAYREELEKETGDTR